jgi:hypothetical protein
MTAAKKKAAGKKAAKKRPKKSAKKATAKSTAKKSADKQRDQWRLVGTYIGEKQFRRGERLGLGYVSKRAQRVECSGPSLRTPGKYAVHWVKAEDLADLHLERSSPGRRQAGLLKELAELLQAAAAAKKS